MLRLTEIRLPIDHREADIHTAICKYLAIPANDLVGYKIFRRGIDARKSQAIFFVYTVDLEVTDEANLLSHVKNDTRLRTTPDESYHFIARAPEKSLATRPVIIGMGPASLPDWSLRSLVFSR